MLKLSGNLMMTLMLCCGCANLNSDMKVPDNPTIQREESSDVLPVETSFYIHRGKQVVSLQINGRGPFPFFFDTGAAGVMVSSAFRDELQLPVTGTQEAYAPGGKRFEVQTVNLELLEFGEAMTENVEAAVIDLGLGEIVGVIGPFAFEDYGRFAINFASCDMSIGGPAKIREDKNWIEFVDDAPLLNIDLDIGGQIIPAHIDSGAPQLLAVPIKYKELLPLTGPVRIVGRARTVSGEIEILEAPIDTSFALGDAIIQLDAVQFLDLPYANIGLEGLRGVEMEIDWKQNRFAISSALKSTGFKPSCTASSEKSN